MVYLYYTSCLRYTILVGNPRYVSRDVKQCAQQSLSGDFISVGDIVVLEVVVSRSCG